MQAGSLSLVRITTATALTGLFGGLAISLISLPPQYTAETFITVAANRMKTPVNEASFNSLEKASGAELAFVLNNSKDRFLSATSLAPIIKDEDLYPQDRERVPFNVVLDNMRKNITVTPGQNGDLAGFTLKFAYPDPQVAQKVARVLTGRWMDATLDSLANAQSTGRPSPPLVLRVSETKTSQRNFFLRIAFRGSRWGCSPASSGACCWLAPLRLVASADKRTREEHLQQSYAGGSR